MRAGRDEGKGGGLGGMRGKEGDERGTGRDGGGRGSGSNELEGRGRAIGRLNLTVLVVA